MRKQSARPLMRIGLISVLALLLAIPHLVTASPLPAGDVSRAPSAWQVVSSPSITSMYGLDMINSSEGWTGGMAGFFFHYNGTTWQPHPTTFSSMVNAVDMLTDAAGWGVTWQGEILRYNGTTWVVHSKPATSALNDLAMVSSMVGFAVGGVGTDGHGTILRYDLANNTWSPMFCPATTWLKAIDMVNANDGWIVGVSGTFLRWNGSGWAGSSLGIPVALAAVDMVDSNDGWAAGSGGSLFHWNGSAWSQVTSPTTNDLSALAMVSRDEGWAVGELGTILHYKNGEWTVQASPTIQGLSNIQMLSPTEGWIVGKGGVILKYVGAPDLSSSTLSVNLSHVSAGQELEYSIAVHNTGTQPAASVVVSDVIPLNTTLLPASITLSQGSLAGTDPLLANLGDVPAGGTATVSFRVTVGNPAACWFAANQATILAGDERLDRQAFTTVGTCLKTYLPLLSR